MSLLLRATPYAFASAAAFDMMTCRYVAYFRRAMPLICRLRHDAYFRRLMPLR